MKIKRKYQTNEKFIMKRIEKNYYYRNKTSIQFKDLVISYFELENRLKATEEKLKNLSVNDSEKH